VAVVGVDLNGHLALGLVGVEEDMILLLHLKMVEVGWAAE